MADRVPLLTSKALADAGFAHGFTTRVGGVSEPPFESLDFAILRDATRLRENQRRLAEAVTFDVARLYQARQVHGARVLVARGDPARMIDEEADAIVAEGGTGCAVAVRVADCVPVLVGDPRGGRVAAVHAGWRGVVGGVLASASEALAGLAGAAPLSRDACVAAIGPCIGPCCFEVGADVAAEIARASFGAPVVARRAGDKAYVDLRSAVRAQLVALGLRDDHIDDVPGCTRCDAARFYSFRRDGDRSGRLVGVIVTPGARPDRSGSPP